MMKLILLISTSILLFACSSGSDKVNSDHLNFPATATGQLPEHLPELSFTDTVFNFGTITEGEKVEYTYKFVNSGDAELVISRVETSCGCTALKSWPREPISPGDGGVIEVVFNSDQKTGKQNKSIKVIANTYPATNILHLTGEVVGPNSK